MRKKLMKTMALVLSFVMICLNVDTKYIKAEDTDITIKNHGVNNAVEKPATLDAGQVWTNKDVVDHGDGTFTITLSAMANNYQDGETIKAPLKEETSLTFTDVIGNGFEVEGTLPADMTLANGTATWTLKSDQLTADANGPVIKTVSFKVKYSAKESGTYYTNGKAEAQFTPSEDNPFYYDVTSATETTEKVVTAKADKNLENGIVKQTFKTTGWIELEAKTLEQPKAENEEDSRESGVKEAPATFDPSTIVPLLDAAPLYDYSKNSVMYRSARLSGVPTNFTPTKNSNIETSKIAEFDPNSNTANITLETYLTGEVSMSGNPIDFVLVLDQSGSMDDPFEKNSYYKVYGDELSLDGTKYYVYVNNYYTKLTYESNSNRWYYSRNNRKVYCTPKVNENDSEHTQFYAIYTKKVALKKSVSNFIDLVEKNAKDSNFNHRIAMVGFAMGEYTENSNSYPAYKNTEVLSLNNPMNYKNINQYNEKNVYGNALQNTLEADGRSILNQAVNSISASGATNIDLGMEMAKKILDYNKTENRDKVVITFTDGLPTKYSGYSENIANDAIKTANDIKIENHATCYSIGVVTEADPSADIYNTPTSDKNIINKFLHLISNNYVGNQYLNMDAIVANLWPGYGKPNNLGYYLAANDADSLKEIFENIFSQVVPKIELDSDTMLIDKISKYFKGDIPKENITVYKQPYNGGELGDSNSWGEKINITNEVTIKTEGDTITVTGYDYSKNFVYLEDGTPVGYKLVVVIKDVEPIDGFVGGNEVPTNKDDSGIYDKNNKVVENFDTPDVDVPLKYDFQVKDASIYIGDNWKSVDEFLQNGYLINGKNFEWGGNRNDFAGIEYTIKDGDTVIGTFTVNAGENKGSLEVNDNFDTTDYSTTHNFSISAVVKPTQNGSYGSKDITDKMSHLYVFTPDLNVTDKVIFYGDLTKVKERYNSDEVEWKCKANSEAPKPLTNQPSLNLNAQVVNREETIDNNIDVELSEDTQFKLNVKRTDTNKDITANTGITNKTPNSDKDDSHDFTIYVVKGQLNITKKINQQYVGGDDEFIKANQSFLYKIERKDKDGNVLDTFYQTIDFSANQNTKEKTVKIKGLKKGYYTVTEITDWSWKYELKSQADDYSGNAENTTSNIYIGDDTTAYTRNKPYYGVEEDTTKLSVEYSNPANTNFENEFIQALSNLFGDVASAINQFINK